MSTASSTATGCSVPSPPSGASSARPSARTTAAGIPCPESSPTAPRLAWSPARPTPPASATPAAASPPPCCARWPGGRPGSCTLASRVPGEPGRSRTAERRPDRDVSVRQRPTQPHGMKGEQYRTYPESLTMGQVSVDARGKDNRAEQFKVVTTLLDASIDGGQIGD